MYNYKNGEHPCVYFSRVELPNLEMTEKDALLYLADKESNFENFKNGKIRVSNNIAYKLSMLTNKTTSYWLNLQEKYDIINS